MKKNWVSIILILIFLGITYKIISYRTKTKITLTSLNQKINDLYHEIDENEVKRVQELIDFHKFNYSTYPIDIKLLKNKEENVFLKNLVNNRGKLVYRISDKVCSICYDEVIKELKYYSGKIGNENILILVPIDRIRELKAYLEELECNISFYGIKTNNILTEIDEHFPFFFYIDDQMLPKHVFIPSKNEIDNTKIYLDIIKERYF